MFSLALPRAGDTVRPTDHPRRRGVAGSSPASPGPYSITHSASSVLGPPNRSALLPVKQMRVAGCGAVRTGGDDAQLTSAEKAPTTSPIVDAAPLRVMLLNRLSPK